ncbi:glycosyl hydrolase 108 family protein [Xanthobacter oligotrophicus]|uniref:Glycosyl hydrolase 108 family protein n=1 Tax=Xanthobacter oligotrophicus TaxID=2607286 RepID=A0ABW6ZUF2_9HYPH
MARENFEAALAAVLVHEGGYSNHPDDPGGPTMKGIIKRVYDDYRRSKGLPIRDVRKITKAEIEDIYKTRYWDLSRCDDLPTGLDYVVFDGAVNSGVGQAAKWLQRALGVEVTAKVNASTIKAAQQVSDVDAVVTDVQNRRFAMLKGLRTWPVFGKGWGRRVTEVRRLGLALAAGSQNLPMPKDTASGKAYAEAAKGHDTDGEAPVADTAAPAEINPDDGLNEDEVREIQKLLRAKKYFGVGRVDGKWGANTAGALRKFQEAAGLPITVASDRAWVDAATIAALVTGPDAAVSESRATTTAATLRQHGDQVAKASWWTKAWAWVMGAPAAAVGVMGQASDATDKLGPVKSFLGDVPGWAWALAVAGVAVALYLTAQRAERAAVDAVRSGRDAGPA